MNHRKWLADIIINKNHKTIGCIVCLLSLVPFAGKAQTDYEIQVYSSEITPEKAIEAELHSNIAFFPKATFKNGNFPVNNRYNETIEITRGFNTWFEFGVYIFSSLGNGNVIQYGGSHIRPKVSIPKSRNLPVGLSISTEIGFERGDSTYDWGTEIRPIIDKKIKKLYLSFNPVIEKSFTGEAAKGGYLFSPNFKICYYLTKTIIPGFEYYGALGPFNKFSPQSQQEHFLYLTLDLNIGEKWEFNSGIGYDLTPNSNLAAFKLILGRQVSN